MSKRKVQVAIAVAVVLLLLIGFVFIVLNNETHQSESSFYKAVPIQSAFLVEFSGNDKLEMIHELLTENNIWKEFKNLTESNTIESNLKSLEEILTKNPEYQIVFDQNPIMLSVHLAGKDRVEFLYMMLLQNSSLEQFSKIVAQQIEGKAQMSIRTYSEVKIYDVKYTNNPSQNFTFASDDGILMFSYSPVLIENAIRQLNADSSIADNPEFKKVFSTAGKNVAANIFINFHYFPKLMSLYMNDESANILENITGFASWAGLDAVVKTDDIMLNGFTTGNDNAADYMAVFAGQNPQKIHIYEVFPDNVYSFSVLGFSDIYKFRREYKKYLTKKDRIHIYERDVRSFIQEFGIDVETMFYSILDNELAVVRTAFTNATDGENRFIVAKINSQSKAKDEMFRILSNYAELNSISENALVSYYKIDEDDSTAIYKMPIHNIVGKLFGKQFSGVTGKYFTFIDNYLILGHSQAMLSEYLHNHKLKKTLEKDNNYNDFHDEISSRSNLYFYLNIARSPSLLPRYTNVEVKSYISKNINVFRKFQAASLQFSSKDKRMFTDIYMKRNPVYKHESTAVWQSRIDTSTAFKPRLVKNHNTGEREIFVQDDNNKIYLLNNSGRVLWEKQLNEPIMGHVFQADYYKNDKLQLLFSTRNELHLIDRNGNYVERYPLFLPTPATNPLNVFDYENDRNYRLMIACEDNNVYCYDIKANKVNGWKFGKTEGKVSSEIQHFTIKNRDYIIFGDQNRVYILDRQGNERVKLKENFAKSVQNGFYLDMTEIPERLVTTGIDGTIYSIMLNGNVEKEKIVTLSDKHYFVCSDIDREGKKDYVFLDGDNLEVYSRNKKMLFEYEFKQLVTDEPIIFRFPRKQTKIGITSRGDNQIFLFNSDGTLYNGFPLVGSSLFSITYLSPDNPNLNLIVGEMENFITNYSLQ